MSVGKLFFVGRERVEALVLDLDQAKLLKVRVGVAPAAALVEPHPVSQDLAQRAFGILKVEALESWFLQPLAADLGRGAIKTERRLLSGAELVAA